MRKTGSPKDRISIVPEDMGKIRLVLARYLCLKIDKQPNIN